MQVRRLAVPLLLTLGIGPACGPRALDAQLRDPFLRSFAGPVNNDQETTSGAAWADMDGDGDLDLFVSAYGNRDNLLYENLGDASFRRVGAGVVVSDAGLSSGAAWADVDGDGLDDLFVANQGGQDNFLYRNLGGGAFERLEGPVQRDRGDSYAGAWADFDLDGRVDLFVANRSGQGDFLYRNLGDGRFERVRDGPVAGARGSSFTGAWSDVDLDGLPDLLVLSSDPERPNALYRNLGAGAFERMTEGAVAVDAAASGRAAWGDYDNDGDFDLYVANGGFFSGTEEVPFLYRNDGGRLVRVLSGPPVQRAVSGSDAAWLDMDNDGDLDLVAAAYREHNGVYRNDGEGRLTPVTTGWAAGHGGFTDAVAVADYDRDGDLDLYLTHWEAQNDVLLTNEGNANHWLSVRLEGTRSNGVGLGALVRATAVIGGREVTQLRQMGVGRGARGQDAREVHFGLGDATTVRTLAVRWPSGEETVVGPLEADRFLVVREGAGVVASAPPRTVDPAPPPANVIFSAFRSEGVEGALAGYRTLEGRLPEAERAAALALVVRHVFDVVDPEDGMALARAALDEAPERPSVLFTVAELQRAAGEAERASDLYRRVLELLPETEGVDPDDARWMERVSVRYATGVR